MALKKVLLTIFILFFLASCTTSLQEVIDENYVEQNGSLENLDKYSKLLTKKEYQEFQEKINNQSKMCQRLDLKDDIVYIKLDIFNKRTLECFEGIEPYSGVIIDLRDNGGGLLKEAIALVDLFVANGEIITTKSKDEKKVYSAKSQDTLSEIPIVVLINKNSASASEIVAGSLKENKRAIIIGNRSFGKGTIQQIIPIDDKNLIKLTTAKYYLPHNKSIEGVGVKPDIVILNSAPYIKSSIVKFNYLTKKHFDANGDIALEVAAKILKNW